MPSLSQGPLKFQLCSLEVCVCRAGGTGPAAPVLAGPIFQAPTIYF